MFDKAIKVDVLQDFKAHWHGELIGPDDDGYQSARRVWNGAIDKYADQHTIEPLEDLGIASILLQTALFMGFVLFALRHWRLPQGAFTLLYVINSTMSSLMAKSSLVIAVAILAALTGFLLDLLHKGLKPGAAGKAALLVKGSPSG